MDKVIIEDRVAIWARRAALTIEKKANQVLVPYGITDTQFNLIMCLYRAPDCSLRQVDLEDLMGMRNPTITGIVQNLERNGFVDRIPNKEDRRSKLVRLTPKTLSMMETLIETGESLEASVTESLTEDEYEQAIQILKKIAGS